jgi:hypothetical protein
MILVMLPIFNKYYFINACLDFCNVTLFKVMNC